MCEEEIQGEVDRERERELREREKERERERWKNTTLYDKIKRDISIQPFAASQSFSFLYILISLIRSKILVLYHLKKLHSV